MTEFDAEPMPNMEEIINRMSGHKYFTKMDLSKGYWQVGLTERSKPLTAFETPRGLFQFGTMPFGLVNSGATFCRLMRIILSNLPNVDSFVDDMWIFTETWKDHMTSLRQVLDRLSWFNWWVSFAPEFLCCYFCESSCLFYLSFNFDFYVSKIIHL